MKRMIALLLVVMMMAMLLPAAGFAEGGVYVENLVNMPDGYAPATAIAQSPDGAVALAAKNRENGAWALLKWRDQQAAPEVLPLEHDGADIDAIAIAPDGSIVAAISLMPMLSDEGPQQDGNQAQMQGEGHIQMQDEVPAQGGAPVMKTADEAPAQAPGEKRVQTQTQTQGGGRIRIGAGDIKTTLVWFDENGKQAARFEVNDMVAQLAAFDGRRVAVSGMMNGVSIYDERGQAVQQISIEAVRAISARGGTLYVMGMDKLSAIDASSGQKQGSLELDLGFLGEMCLLAAPDGMIYLMDNSGLQRVDAELTGISRQMDSMGTLVGDPSNGVNGLAMLPDGAIAALISEGGGSYGGFSRTVSIGSGDQSNLLACYSLDAQIDAANRQTFTITALRNSSKLQKAASDFQRAHPELNVKLQTQMSQDDESPVGDHIRTLNTDLLAGKGGDVLVLDDLPMEKYAQRGLLLDLGERLADIALLPGVRSASTGADGSMYAIPSQFTFDLLWGNRQIIDALSSLAELRNIPLESGQTPLAPRTYREWIELFYPANEASFLDDQGKPNFESAEFAQFLEALYWLYAEQGDMPSDLLAGKGGMSATELIAMVNGATALYPAKVYGLTNLTVAYTISGAEDSGFSLPLTLDGVSRAFTPSLRLGIGSQSQNPELAEEFIRLMLSPEVQEIEEIGGLPTVAASLDKLFEDAFERSRNRDKNMMVISLNGANPLTMTFPDEQILTELRALCDTLDVSVLPDDTLMGFIVEECDAFFAGRVSAEDAARAIEQRAWAYLNE